MMRKVRPWLAASIAVALSVALCPQARAVMPGEGARVLFSRVKPNGKGQPQVFSMRSDGSDVRRLTGHAGTHLAALAGHWSPDGKRIAYISGTKQADIYLMNRDGSHKVRLTHTHISEVWPCWSTDGKRIAYATFHFNGSGPSTLMVMNAKGRNVYPVYSGDAFNPAWMPGHNVIGFSASDNTDTEIYTIRGNGKHLTAITNDGVDETFMDWSADGARILYLQDGDLWTIAADGSDPQQVTTTGDVSGGLYTPSGRVLSQEASGGSDSEIWIQNADGGSRRQLTDNDAQDLVIFDFF